jgi:hypothetical protein
MIRHHIALGENCLIDKLLDKYGLKEESYTFGSVRTNISINLQILKDDFKNFIAKKHLYSTWLEEDQKNVIKNSFYTQTEDIFNETVSTHFEFTHHNVLENEKDRKSFNRKIDRLKKRLKSRDEIIFYYNYRNSPNNNLEKLLDLFREFTKQISRKYGHTRIKYVIFYQNQNTETKHFKIKAIQNITLIECFDKQEWRGKKNVFAKSFSKQFDEIFAQLHKSNEYKKDVIVTIGNEKFVDQAKQLFSSVYFNSGWKGDYLLLAHGIPEEKLAWFKEKGILIKKCDEIDTGLIGKFKCPAARTLKFALFTRFFKKWRTIVYLDADIIVKGCLDDLVHKNGFWACQENLRLKDHFISSPSSLRTELKKEYNLKQPAFNSGVMVFDTQIIHKKNIR